MAIKNWSESILLVELGDDPLFTEDILAAIERFESNAAQDAALSFAAVSFINSSNLAKLLKLRRLVNAAGRRLRLCCISAHVWGVFLATGLDKVFEFSDDVTTALASLQMADQTDQ
jgi:anti-anti-sigma factor